MTKTNIMRIVVKVLSQIMTKVWSVRTNMETIPDPLIMQKMPETI